MADVHVVVDEAVCAGTGYCQQVAPDLFVLDERPVAVPTGPFDPTDLDRLEQAEALCPLDAIHIQPHENER